MANPEPIPESFIDMITYELLEDPVVAEDNFVYSRNSLLDWFDGCAEVGEPITSPLTGRPMGTNMRPEPNLARQIEQFKARGGRSQRFNESTQTIGTLAKIFEIIDPLRDLFATKNWQAPALVVMGNENSGKSTLLERLAMMPIFPKDKFICTRMAIRVHLRRGPCMAPRLDVFDKQTGTVMWSKVVPMERGRDFVKEAMETVLIQEFGGLTGVSKTKMLILHITGPNCPDLDMVDLPGLVSTHVRGEPENMRALTADLVESYVRENNSHSLYLVALPATAAPNQSLAFEVVQKMGLHDRSIGVFTKSDKCDLKDEGIDGLGGLKDLRSKVYQQARDTVPLEQWGYVCTMNRPQDDSNKSNYNALITQSQDEVNFFVEKGMSDLLGAQMAGCKALLTRISIMFHDYLRSTWAPSTILLLRDETADYRDKERALGFPRADSFLPVGHREEGPDARVTRDEVASIALERATTMLAAAASHTMDTLAVEMLQRLHIQIVEESCEVAGKPSEVLAHQLNLKHNISQYIADALEELENMVVSQVAGAMSDDDSEFKLGRFPQFINAMSKIFIRQLAPWKDKTDAALMSYVNVAFQSPLSNPHFKLKYTFLNDGDGLYPHCEMDFDAEALAATIVHTIVLRCSILLTETVGIEADIKALLHSVDFTESCAAERNIYLKGLYHVEKVVNQLKAHLELDEEDIDHFRRTGSILPVDTIEVVRNALSNANATIHGQGGLGGQQGGAAGAAPSHARGGAAGGRPGAQARAPGSGGRPSPGSAAAPNSAPAANGRAPRGSNPAAAAPPYR